MLRFDNVVLNEYYYYYYYYYKLIQTALELNNSTGQSRPVLSRWQ